MMRKILLWAPLMVFALFLGVFLRGLHAPENTTITSKMVGKVVPDFVLPAAVASHPLCKRRRHTAPARPPNEGGDGF